MDPARTGDAEDVRGKDTACGPFWRPEFRASGGPLISFPGGIWEMRTGYRLKGGRPAEGFVLCSLPDCIFLSERAGASACVAKCCGAGRLLVRLLEEKGVRRKRSFVSENAGINCTTVLRRENNGEERRRMFSVNDMIMYGNYGVCRIADIRPEKFGREERMYYVLKPAEDQTSTIYCPVDIDREKFRRLLSAEEIYALVDAAPTFEEEWIEDDQERQAKFQETLRHGNHEALVRLVRTLYAHREARRRSGRKFHSADQKIMKEAEGILCSEFAHVLHLRQEEVLPFIVGKRTSRHEGAAS